MATRKSKNLLAMNGHTATTVREVDCTASTPEAQFQKLTEKAMQTLEAILSDETVPVQDRAKTALQILQLAGFANHAGTDSSSKAQLGEIFQQLPTPQSSGLTIQDTSQLLTSEHNSSQSFSAQTQPILSPTQIIQIENFLSLGEYQEILEIALSHTSDFVETSTTTRAADHRRSSALYATFFPQFYNLLRQKILNTVPSVLESLNLSPFTISQVEMQLTAHNDGCYYRVHNDSGDTPTETRVLTYVYYFYREPKGFSGGELKLYETELNGKFAKKRDRSHTIEPHNNSIVFFNSRCMHEVMPVSCPSRKFEDSRFTLNGWLRRG